MVQNYYYNFLECNKQRFSAVQAIADTFIIMHNYVLCLFEKLDNHPISLNTIYNIRR